jgi:DNA-directed RNA polymerase specialized sigma24 family protein
VGISLPASSSEGTFAPSESDVLSELFASYHQRVTSYIYSRLIRQDWHLAEDLTTEVFIELMRSYTMRGREVDARVWGLLATIARRVISHHFRRPSAGESATDFGNGSQASRLPSTPGAGDVAMVRIEARRELAELPEPTTPAARRRVEALTVMAVAA